MYNYKHLQYSESSTGIHIHTLYLSAILCFSLETALSLVLDLISFSIDCSLGDLGETILTST